MVPTRCLLQNSLWKPVWCALSADIPIACRAMDNMVGVPIIYSLGNFWFSASTLDTGLSQVIIRDDGTIDFRFLPCIQKNYKTSLVTDESEKRRIFDFMESLSVGITIDDDGYVTATE